MSIFSSVLSYYHKEEAKVFRFTCLPKDIQHYIVSGFFSHLDLSELRRVCKRWCEWIMKAYHPNLWAPNAWSRIESAFTPMHSPDYNLSFELIPRTTWIALRAYTNKGIPFWHSTGVDIKHVVSWTGLRYLVRNGNFPHPLTPKFLATFLIMSLHVIVTKADRKDTQVVGGESIISLRDKVVLMLETLIANGPVKHLPKRALLPYTNSALHTYPFWVTFSHRILDNVLRHMFVYNFKTYNNIVRRSRTTDSWVVSIRMPNISWAAEHIDRLLSLGAFFPSGEDDNSGWDKWLMTTTYSKQDWYDLINLLRHREVIDSNGIARSVWMLVCDFLTTYRPVYFEEVFLPMLEKGATVKLKKRKQQ